MTTKTLKRIEALLYETAGLQKPYTKKMCSMCEAPCCVRVQYLFNEKDILFLRLSGRKRIWKRKHLKKKGCWFLGQAGCLLEPLSRPMICHNYICVDLEREMESREPGLISTLREKLSEIGTLRSRMWAEYLEGGISSKGQGNIPVLPGGRVNPRGLQGIHGPEKI